MGATYTLINQSEVKENTQLYRYQKDNGTVFKIEFMGFELVRVTNLSLDPTLFKPYVISQHDFVTELHSDRIVRIK